MKSECKPRKGITMRPGYTVFSQIWKNENGKKHVPLKITFSQKAYLFIEIKHSTLCHEHKQNMVEDTE